MATARPIRKPIDNRGYINGSGAISKAKALAWVLEHLGPAGSLEGAFADHGNGSAPPETHDWLHGMVSEALHAALDEIAVEYSKLAPEPMLKEIAERNVTPKGE